MRKESHAVEILPTFPIDTMCGSIKHSTFRVTQSGKNIVTDKECHSGNKGRSSTVVQSASIKWRSLNKVSKEYWQEIADDYAFYSRWTAFVSSFFLSVDQHGLDYTMAQELNYFHSQNRHNKQEHWENSRKRRSQYKANPLHYLMTAYTLMNYPVEHICPLIYVRLLDLRDVNNALRCRMARRTDSIVEYEYYADPSGDGSTGTYSRKERPRTGDKVFELFYISE